MTRAPWTPDEFARIAALPEGHPDRERAKSSPAFEAWLRMHEAFIAPAPESARAAALDEAEIELTRRLAAARRAPMLAPPIAAEKPRSRRAYMPQLAAAAALVVVVGIIAVMSQSGPGSRRVRGAGPNAGALELATPYSTGQGVVLDWRGHSRADAYRLVFYGGSLEEIAHVDVRAGTHYLMRSDSLADGLTHGRTVRVAVLALNEDRVLETSPMREVRVP